MKRKWRPAGFGFSCTVGARHPVIGAVLLFRVDLLCLDKFMSAVQNPQEKKRLSYVRDHYNRNGENNKSWRRKKPIKKRDARRAFRKASNDLVKVIADGDGPVNAVKKLGSVLQSKVHDWGAIHLRQFVENRKEQRQVRADSGQFYRALQRTSRSA